MTATLNNRLLVEGKNDAHVLFSLFDRHGIPFGSPTKPSKQTGSISIQQIFTNTDSEDDINPVDFFAQQLKLMPELGCLGIILDADFNLEGKWMALRNRLLQFGFSEAAIEKSEIDKRLISTGAIIQDHDLPTVGVWLMPDNCLEGELEHFLEFLITQKKDNPLWSLVVETLEKIPEENTFPDYSKRFKEQDRRKALIHTWLAWQEEPGKPLGQALTARYFDAEAPHALIFINWVRQLFLSNPI